METKVTSPHELLTNTLLEAGKVEPGDICQFFDCRCFGDPNRGELRQHVGLHPDIAAGLLGARMFRGFWREIKQTLLPALRVDRDIGALSSSSCAAARRVAAGERLAPDLPRTVS